MMRTPSGKAKIIRGPHVLWSNENHIAFGIEVINLESEESLKHTGHRRDFVINSVVLKQDPIGYKQFLGMAKAEWDILMKEFDRLERTAYANINSGVTA